MRQKVLSTQTYRGYTIEHIEDEVHKGTGWGWGANYHARYVKKRFWWIVEPGWDEPRLKDAKKFIDELLAAKERILSSPSVLYSGDTGGGPDA